MMEEPQRKERLFATTQWSLVLAAADDDRTGSREALSELCERYWYPIYAQVRFRQRDAEKARDLTQGFFAHILERNSLKIANRERGRFRAFLKTTLKHYLANEQRHDAAQKRGGPLLSLDFDAAEKSYRLEPGHTTTPEVLFERHWARAVVSSVLDSLRAEHADRPGQERFHALEPLLIDRPGRVSYRQLAKRLGTSEAAVKVAVHRLRKRFGVLLREEVARTVKDAGDVDDEIRFLLGVLDPA